MSSYHEIKALIIFKEVTPTALKVLPICLRIFITIMQNNKHIFQTRTIIDLQKFNYLCLCIPVGFLRFLQLETKQYLKDKKHNHLPFSIPSLYINNKHRQ